MTHGAWLAGWLHQVQRLRRAITLSDVGGVNDELLERAKEKLAVLEQEYVFWLVRWLPCMCVCM